MKTRKEKNKGTASYLALAGCQVLCIPFHLIFTYHLSIIMPTEWIRKLRLMEVKAPAGLI